MAHFRRAVGAALVLNTSLCAVEMAAGIQAQSLSLLTDSIHNCSDELALGCLYLAFYLPGYLGRHSQRTANLLNSLGLIVLSVVSRAPVCAGALVVMTHRPEVDGLMAGAIALWLPGARRRRLKDTLKQWRLFPAIPAGSRPPRSSTSLRRSLCSKPRMAAIGARSARHARR